MSLKDDLLAPFHGAGEAGQELLAGSGVIVRAAGRGLCSCLRLAAGFIAKGETFQDRMENLGVVALAGVVALLVGSGILGAVAYVAGPYAGVIGSAGAAAWIVTAWAVAPKPEEEDATENDHEESTGEQPHQPDPHELPNRMARLVITAVTEAETAGYKGVHVVDLLNQMRAAGIHAFDEVGSLRQWLEASQFPVSRNLKLRGKGNTWGVRADDLTAALGMPLSEALAALTHRPASTPAESTPDTPAQAAPAAPATPAVEAEPSTPSGRHLTPVPTPSPEAAA